MIVIEWDGDDLHNLLNLPNSELYKLYCQFYSGTKQSQRETIRRIANNKRNFYRQGKIQMPERSQPYDPEKEPDRLNSYFVEDVVRHLVRVSVSD